jgi:hypothetical protein
VELLLFDHEDDSRPGWVIPICPALNHTYHFWHTFVPGVQPGQIYGYRTQGPYDTQSGANATAAGGGAGGDPIECDAGRSIEEAVQGSFRLASQGADVRLFPILPTSRFLSILAV